MTGPAGCAQVSFPPTEPCPPTRWGRNYAEPFCSVEAGTTVTQADDPWAWAHERPAEAVPDLNTASVLAVLVATRTRVAGVLDCLGRLERRPDRIVVVGEQTADGTTGGEAPWPGAQFRGTSGAGFSAAVKEGLTGATEE